MTRFPASGGGSGPPYTYVMDGYPDGAEEGESLYHITEDSAYVYTGSSWVEQTVTNHSQLAGVSEGDHRSDQRVADLAPVQSVNGQTGDATISTGDFRYQYYSASVSYDGDNGYKSDTKYFDDFEKFIVTEIGFNVTSPDYSPNDFAEAEINLGSTSFSKRVSTSEGSDGGSGMSFLRSIGGQNSTFTVVDLNAKIDTDDPGGRDSGNATAYVGGYEV